MASGLLAKVCRRSVENKRPDVLSVRVDGSDDGNETVTSKTCSVKVVGLKWPRVAIETEL